MYKGYYGTAATTTTFLSSRSPKGRRTSPVAGVSLLPSSDTIFDMTYLVAGNVPAALGNEALDALVDLRLGSNNLVLHVLSDNHIT